jgi:hypothetical protein
MTEASQVECLIPPSVDLEGVALGKELRALWAEPQSFMILATNTSTMVSGTGEPDLSRRSEVTTTWLLSWAYSQWYQKASNLALSGSHYLSIRLI